MKLTKSHPRALRLAEKSKGKAASRAEGERSRATESRLSLKGENMTHQKLVEVVKELSRQHNELERRAAHTQRMLDALLTGLAGTVSTIEKVDAEVKNEN